MDKPKKKNQKYNDEVIEALISKYGFKANYIRMSIRGERVGTIPIKIQEEYKKLDAQAKAAIQASIKKI